MSNSSKVSPCGKHKIRIRVLVKWVIEKYDQILDVLEFYHDSSAPKLIYSSLA